MAARPTAGTIALLIIAAPVTYLLVSMLASMLSGFGVPRLPEVGPLAEPMSVLRMLFDHVYSFVTNPVFLAFLVGLSVLYAVLEGRG